LARLGNYENRASGVIARCKLLAGVSEDRESTRRTFLCPAMRDCHRQIAAWLTAAHADVSVDAVGNLHGFYAGVDANAPRVLIGSHLDTVPDAGAYDGVLGVVIGVALLESLAGHRLPFAIEVVGFSEEEGVRFGTPFLGSRALVGRFDEELLNRRDRDGVSVRDAIRAFGLDPGKIPEAKIKEDALAYLEFHIEQGPVLESLNIKRPLGVVEGIAAQRRMEFEFVGRSNHAGTTPMDLRHDAVAAAAEWIVAVESAARNRPGVMATVGRIQAMPGAVNVIAASARVSLDVRHGSDAVCEQVATMLSEQAAGIATRRGLKVRTTALLDQKSVQMDPFLVDQIERAIRSAGCKPHRMVSGAGHDAMILAEKVPAAMILVPSPDGISHDPAESVRTEDVANALECGLQLLDQLAASVEFQKRMCRA
jgi:allantoate deiminase